MRNERRWLDGWAGVCRSRVSCQAYGLNAVRGMSCGTPQERHDPCRERGAPDNATVPLRFYGRASTVRECAGSHTLRRSKPCPHSSRRFLPRPPPPRSCVYRSRQPLPPALYSSPHGHWDTSSVPRRGLPPCRWSWPRQRPPLGNRGVIPTDPRLLRGAARLLRAAQLLRTAPGVLRRQPPGYYPAPQAYYRPALAYAPPMPRFYAQPRGYYAPRTSYSGSYGAQGFSRSGGFAYRRR